MHLHKVMPHQATTFLAKDYTSFIIFEGESSSIAQIFSRLASIPLCDMMNSRNFSELTPKAYFVIPSLPLFTLNYEPFV